jgi:hypothetical protein
LFRVAAGSPRLTRAAAAADIGAMREHDNRPDAIEVWARRVGRTLGYIFMLSLAAYLVAQLWPRQ